MNVKTMLRAYVFFSTHFYLKETMINIFTPLTATIFTIYQRVLHKEAWFTKLLGIHLSVQVHEKVKFSGRDISSLAVKG